MSDRDEFGRLEDDELRREAAEERHKRRMIFGPCLCGGDMPGHCPGPNNCPMQEHEDEPEDSPYCECNESPTEDEFASNHCSACGKELPYV